LSVTNLAGTLAANDSFKLFTANSYGGTFASITPAAPGDGLAWDTSGLTNNGTLKVVAALRPTIGRITITSGNVIISGEYPPGSGGTYHILTTTNVALPIANWAVLTNGTFDNNGNFASTNDMGTSAQRYYILQVP